MRKQIPESVMEARRQDRLRQLCFFMLDERAKPLRSMSREATHLLLRGWFQNSHWKTAWYCIHKAFKHEWQNAQSFWTVFYYRKILRLNDAEMDARFLDSIDK